MGDILDQRSLAPFIHDERFLWVENERQLGVRSNFEKATNLVLQRMPDLIAFSDQDDIWLPNKLEESTIAISESGPRTMVYCDAFLLVEGVVRAERLHDFSMKTKGKMSITERIIQPQVSGFCAVFDASLAQLHPIIPAAFPDHDHWYSLVATSYGGVFRINQPLALYRQHAGNVIGISTVRTGQGWDQTLALKRYASLRENAELRANIARQVGLKLPISPLIGLLYRHTAGWLLILLGLIAKRIFTDRYLSANAYRKAWGLLLVIPSKRVAFERARSYLPKRVKIVRVAVATILGLVSIGSLVLLNTQAFIFGELLGGMLGLLLLASTVITLLRAAQHQMPNTIMLLVGFGALSGIALLALNCGTQLVLAGAALPLIANIGYRLRWAARS
jgi:hypothetical protein